MPELLKQIRASGFMAITELDVNRAKQLKEFELEQFRTWLKEGAK